MLRRLQLLFYHPDRKSRHPLQTEDSGNHLQRTLARNNEKKVTGIVINAFTEPFVMPMELLDIIAEMDSAIENPENE